MNQWRSFSVSIFMICLLEFVFWSYCTVVAASAAEEMFMKTNIEAFKVVGDEDDSTQESSHPAERDDPSSSPHQQLNDDEVTNATSFAALLGNSGNDSPASGSQALAIWLAIAVGLLGVRLLFPHHTKKIVELLARPVELYHMLKFKFVYKVPDFPKDLSEADVYSYEKLIKVSRSFAAVIAELPEELRRPIANFYLVLRGLDTVEDDMSIPLEKKVPELRNFYKHLYERGWNVSGYGDNKDERDLLERFHHVVDVFLDLRPAYQTVIADITRRMGEGMAQYALDKKVVTLEDYNEYCHYVAGLVGIGLSQMFAASGLESERFGQMDELANSMGLFLQKTNITRDYLEDVTAVNPRIFYPKDIWGKYAKDIVELKELENKEAAMQCLNEMVTNAMAHITDCLDYMMLLKHPNVFKFCGIPQAMAIATLARIYNNYEVFQKEVKIRKGEAVQVMMYGGDYETIIGYFHQYIRELEAKIPAHDPNAEKMRNHIAVARSRIAKGRTA